MKILQLIQKPQLRGAEVFACQLSNELIELGHEVHIVSLLPGVAAMPFHGKIVQLDRPSGRRFMDIKGWKKLAACIEEYKPDVVQANAGDTLKYAVLSKLFFRWKAPIVFRNASTISLYIKSSWVKRFNKFLFQYTHHVISVSKYSGKDLLHLFPFMQGKISVIPIGISLTPTDSRSIEKSHVLHVGGFTFEKNHEGLLRIFGEVVKRNKAIELWLVGDGPLRVQTELKVNELGLQKHVRFLGYRKDVLPLMKNASMVALPSIIEGLPGVLLEAMYCRTPVVAYDVGGISEVVRNGETGWLVQADDEVGFVKAIQDVLQAADLDAIKENAYKLVLSEYDNKVIAKRFVEVYEKVAGSQLPISG